MVVSSTQRVRCGWARSGTVARGWSNRLAFSSIWVLLALMLACRLAGRWAGSWVYDKSILAKMAKSFV